MNEFVLPLLAFALGLMSGFIGGIASGGGLISIPGLMFLGLSPSSAIATNNLGVISAITSARRYHKHTSINMRLVRSLTLVSVLGSLLGASILLIVNITLMQKLFGAACILLAVLMRANKHVNRTGKRHKILAPVLIFLSDIFAGLFGTGGGLFVIYSLSYCYGLPLREANAHSKLIALGGTATALAVFAHAGVINLHAGIPMVIGSALGGHFGANTALKKEEKLVRNLLIVIALTAGMKLLV